MRRTAALLAALVLTGCTTLTPAQQARVDAYQALADRVTAHYGASRVLVMRADLRTGTGGVMEHRGRLLVSERTLTSRWGEALVAHELAHWVLGHRFEETVPGPDKELAAHVEAVRVLMVGKSWIEEQAFRTYLAYLWSAKLAQDRGTPVPLGHRAVCREIADFVSRFPAQASMAKTCPGEGKPEGRP